MSSKHLFALYSPLLPTQPGEAVHFTDQELWRRITQVLRLAAGDLVTLYNKKEALTVTLDALTFNNKKSLIIGRIEQTQPVQQLLPLIHAIIGLTKREAFEEALYSCSQLGVTTVTPLLTKRVHRNWLAEKELARLEKIMIAAGEQAKQFCLPTLNLPLELELLKAHKNLFVCAPEGKPLSLHLNELANAHNPERTIIIGPEGGFDDPEEKFLASLEAQPIALGKSILRTQDATLVILGAWRCLPT